MFAPEIPKTFLGLKDEVSDSSEGGQGGWKKVIIGLNCSFLDEMVDLRLLLNSLKLLLKSLKLLPHQKKDLF